MYHFSRTFHLELKSISVSELAQIKTTMPFYPRPLMVWDMGDEPAAFFSRFMRRPCRVVYRNPTREVYGPQPETGYRFTNALFNWVWPRKYFTNLVDAAPLHIITEESLKKLTLMNGGLEVTPTRFRPNIMLSGCKAWDEETWKMIEVENVGQIAMTSRCPRCGVPDVDEATGKKDPLNRPGTLLQKFHTTDPSLKWGSRPMFGMWAINLFSGTCRFTAPYPTRDSFASYRSSYFHWYQGTGDSKGISRAVLPVT